MKENTRVLKFEDTVKVWDEGMPLGNGEIGCLVWGKAKKLRFSLDKGDIWDTSGQPSQNPEFNFAKLQELVKAGDMKRVTEIFDACYDRPNPTKLPIGAIELSLKSRDKVSSELDLTNAELTLQTGTYSIKSFVHSSKRLGYINISGGAIGVRLDAPKYGGAPSKWRKYAQKGITQSLKNLRYGKAYYSNESAGDITYKYYLQRVNESLSYGIMLGIIKRAENTQIVYTVMSSLDGQDYLDKAKCLVTEGLALKYESAFNVHKEWWKEYWNKSEITIPNKYLERGWYMGNYLLAAGSRKGHYPMPLQGLWTADNGALPPWKGDYHHDLNTQLTYLSYLKANHIEEGECYIDYLLNLAQVGKDFAKQYFAKDGLCLPAVMDIEGNALGGWAMYSLSPTNMLWLCDMIARHFEYAPDDKRVEKEVLPYFKEVERLLAGLLEEREGRLYLPLSSSPEIHDNTAKAYVTPNSNYDLAMMRKFYINLIKMCKDSESVERYTKTLSMLDDLAIDTDNVLMISPDERLKESHRHHSHAIAIYPLCLLEYDNDYDRAIIDATVKNMEELGTRKWVGYSFAWLAEFYAVMKDGRNAEETLQKFYQYFCLPNGFHINGDYTKQGFSHLTYRPFTLEGNFCAMDALQEMLLYSRQGIIEILPALPPEWQDIQYRNLRAEGGVLVSLEYKGGKIKQLILQATADVKFRVRDKHALKTLEGKDILREGEYLLIDMKKDEKLILIS